jgi:type IV secretory pathway TraG/TraD family ATPase VirD4
MNHFAQICFLALAVTLVAYAAYSLLKAFLTRWYATAFLAVLLGLLAAGVFKILPVVLPASVRNLLAPISQVLVGLFLPAGHGAFNMGSVSMFSLMFGGFAGCIAWLCMLISVPRTNTRPGIEAGDRVAASSIEAKSQDAIETEQRLQQSGVFIGTVSGNPMVLPDRETVCHTFLIGSTGSGKTTCALNFIESCAVRNIGCIVIDGKAQGDVKQFCLEMARQYSKPFFCFDINDPCSSGYNPLRNCAPNNYTSYKDMLINLSDWSDDYYKRCSGDYLQTVLVLLLNAKKQLDFKTLSSYLPPAKLFELASKLGIPQDELETIASMQERSNYEGFRGFHRRISELVGSNYGRLFIETGGRQMIDLFTSLQNGDAPIILFSLNFLGAPDASFMAARMIISDIKIVAERLNAAGSHNPVFCICDEAGRYFNRAATEALALLRSYNFHLVVATQSLADIDLVDPTLAESIMTNTNTLICLKINSATEADRLAKRFGTHTVAEHTMRVSQGQHTGESSMRYNESYIVHPNDLKELTPFTAYILRELAQPKRTIQKKVKVRLPVAQIG